MDKLSEHDLENTAKKRRRRVKHIKNTIVAVLTILLILPTLLCILLGIQVNRLQNRVNNLESIHSSEISNLQENQKDNNMIAYAAERNEPNIEDMNDKNYSGDQQTIEDMADASNSLPSEDTKIEQGPNPVTQYDDGVSEIIISDGSKNSEVKASDHEKTSDHSITNENTGTDPSIVEVNENGIYSGKQVYLTFDDGPSIYTDAILDILADYGVKATFFVIGMTDKESKRLYQRIIDEGHTLGMHSYSHKYKEIYKSVEDFDKDFTKLWNLLYDTTGYMPNIYRFPGGSSNLVNRHDKNKIIRYLNKKSILYYDWNVDSGDATGVKYTEDQLVDNILSGIALRRRSIVLMHDVQTKITTVDALPKLLETLISQGAEILPLDEDVKPIQQIKAEEVK